MEMAAGKILGMIIFKLSSEEVVNKGDTVVVIRRDCCDIVSSSFTKQTKRLVSWPAVN